MLRPSTASTSKLQILREDRWDLPRADDEFESFAYTSSDSVPVEIENPFEESLVIAESERDESLKYKFSLNSPPVAQRLERERERDEELYLQREREIYLRERDNPNPPQEVPTWTDRNFDLEAEENVRQTYFASQFRSLDPNDASSSALTARSLRLMEPFIQQKRENHIRMSFVSNVHHLRASVRRQRFRARMTGCLASLHVAVRRPWTSVADREELLELISKMEKGIMALNRGGKDGGEQEFEFECLLTDGDTKLIRKYLKLGKSVHSDPFLIAILGKNPPPRRRYRPPGSGSVLSSNSQFLGYMEAHNALRRAKQTPRDIVRAKLRANRKKRRHIRDIAQKNRECMRRAGCRRRRERRRTKALSSSHVFDRLFPMQHVSDVGGAMAANDVELEIEPEARVGRDDVFVSVRPGREEDAFDVAKSESTVDAVVEVERSDEDDEDADGAPVVVEGKKVDDEEVPEVDLVEKEVEEEEEEEVDDSEYDLAAFFSSEKTSDSTSTAPQSVMMTESGDDE